MQQICTRFFAVFFTTFFVWQYCDWSLTPVWAQQVQRIEVSSWNPVGSGARALGMGGAFIAVADDATAASWNPGGLIQLENPEVSIVGTYVHRAEDNTFGLQPEANGQQDYDFSEINYLSAAYPFNLGGYNMIVSLNYQNLYNFNRQWQYPIRWQQGSFDVHQAVNYESEGSLGAIGLAYSVQISPSFSFGITLNSWNDWLFDNTWEQRTDVTGSGTSAGGAVTYSASSRDKYSFSGFNANLGFLWHATGQLTVGGIFKTPFRGKLDHESWTNSYFKVAIIPTPVTSTEYSLDKSEIDMPMSYGLGLAYRFSDTFTWSLDLAHTRWDDFILYSPDGSQRSPVTFEPTGTADIKPTTQLRTGAEYLFINDSYVIPLRGGLFIDPAPAKVSPDDYYGFSLGSGVAYKRYIFDIAYQFRYADNVSEYFLESLEFSQDVREHTVYASIIVHF